LLPPQEGTGQTVLVVDDQAAVRDVTARILRRHGYAVQEASDAQQALAIAAAGHIDLVLTDIVMPRMSGRQLVEQLRLLRPALPVLYMSGFPRDEWSDEGGLDEDIGLVEKPFDDTTLIRSVQQALAGDAV
jgi:CheY-like chemotaxis protein